MNPADFEQQLETYADGELDPAAARELEARLAGVPEAQSAVERWRALRACARRGLESEPLPVGLSERVRARLAAEGGPRRVGHWRPGVLFTAAAAVVLLMLAYAWVDGSRSRPADLAVAPEALASVYERCACRHHHDPFKLAGRSPAEAERILAEQAGLGLTVHLPDFSEQGYRLAGACLCGPISDIPTLHAYYQRPAAGPAGGTDSDTLSYFTLARLVSLKGTCHHPTPCRSRGMAGCVAACTREGVTVIKWDGPDCTYAVCGRLPETELAELVSAVRAAVRLDEDPAFGAPVARTGRQAPGPGRGRRSALASAWTWLGFDRP